MLLNTVTKLPARKENKICSRGFRGKNVRPPDEETVPGTCLFLLGEPATLDELEGIVRGGLDLPGPGPVKQTDNGVTTDKEW